MKSFTLLIGLLFCLSCEQMQYDRVLIVATDSQPLLPPRSGSVTLKGKILDTGETPVTAIGFCYMDSMALGTQSLSLEKGTVKMVSLPEGVKTGDFQETIYLLNKNTTYVYRAFARTATDLKYGNVFTFRTGDIETPLFKGGVSNITSSRASVKGSVSEGKFSFITSVGGTITGHGHCWSTTINPDITGNKTELGALTEAKEFESELTGLAPGISYYVRAYITYTIGGSTQTEYSSNDDATTIKTQ